MANSWFSCKPCSSSDPTEDTVKIDPYLLNNKDKENVQPLQVSTHNAEEQWQREAKEDADRLLKEEAAAAAAAAAVAREEAARREAEEEARREALERAQREAAEKAEREAAERAEREAAERAREEAAEREREEAAAAAAAAAEAEERERQEQVARDAAAALARKDAEEKVTAWCKSNGFEHMNAPKKTYRGCTKFPLHTAVKHDNQEMIGLMLIAGVRKDVKDSNKQTPSQLAAKLNKNGSRDAVLAMLR